MQKFLGWAPEEPHTAHDGASWVQVYVLCVCVRWGGVRGGVNKGLNKGPVTVWLHSGHIDPSQLYLHCLDLKNDNNLLDTIGNL